MGDEYVAGTVTLSDEEIYETLQTSVWEWDRTCVYDLESKKLKSRETHSFYFKFLQNKIVMSSTAENNFEENPDNVYEVNNKRLIIKSTNYDGTKIDYYSIVRLDDNSIVLDYDSIAFITSIPADTLYKLSRKQEEICRKRFVVCK